jgi:hypothetical protein
VNNYRIEPSFSENLKMCGSTSGLNVKKENGGLPSTNCIRSENYRKKTQLKFIAILIICHKNTVLDRKIWLPKKEHLHHIIKKPTAETGSSNPMALMLFQI